jgi:pimeloyl-ACP methyl ester carboxylesterase
MFLRIIPLLLTGWLAMPLAAEEVRQQFEGLTLNANLELAQAKTLEDGVVLIIHGLQAHNRMEIIEAAQQALLTNGQSSIAINLGLGVDNRSGFYDCSWPHRHGFDQAAVEIQAWIDWLAKQDAGPISLIGHSFGGAQALVYLDRYRESPVSRMILLAPATRGYDRLKNDYLARYQKDLDKVLTRARSMIDAGNGDQLMQNVDFFFCPNTRVSANSFFDYYREDGEFARLPDYLRQADIPVLVIAGSADERQPDVVRLLSPATDGREKKLVVIENAGHFFLDLNIEEAIEYAVEFIEEAG